MPALRLPAAQQQALLDYFHQDLKALKMPLQRS